MVSPREAAFVAGRTLLRARVEPAGEATSVVFYVDGLQICALSRPPFECDWDAGVNVIEHQVRAVAAFTGARHVVSNVQTKGLDYVESVDVRSVQLTATVSDNGGHFVRGLTTSSFRVFEDDRLQTISHFEAENVALDLIVALDISGSMAPSMPALKQAAREFLTSIPMANKVTLLAFNDTTFTLARGATNASDRVRAVDGLVPWGGTALYDVLVHGVKMFGASAGRKALIVFSDGEDYGSGASLEEAEGRLQASEVTVYHDRAGKGCRAGTVEAGHAPAGRPDRRASAVCAARRRTARRLRELLEELSNQYLLSYTPTNGRLDGTMRRVLVEVQGRPRTHAKGVSRTSRGTAMTRRILCSVALAVSVGSMATAVRVRGQQPAFTTAAEALAVDVNVLDGSGTPVSGLGASDFEVRVDGRRRRWGSTPNGFRRGTSGCASDPLQPIPEGYASNRSPTQSGHLIVIAVDKVNLPPEALAPIQTAVGGFIDRVAKAIRLRPWGSESGRVARVSRPTGIA